MTELDFMVELPRESEWHKCLSEVALFSVEALNEIHFDEIKFSQICPKYSIEIFVNSADLSKVMLHPFSKITASSSPLFGSNVFSMNTPTYNKVSLNVKGIEFQYVNFCNYKGNATCKIENVFKEKK